MAGGEEGQQSFNRFQEAVRDGSSEEVAAVLAAEHFPVNFRAPTGRRPIHLLAERGTEALLHQLLDMGAAVNAVDNKCSTALHYASKCGSMPCVQLLLSKGLSAEGMAHPALDDDKDGQEEFEGIGSSRATPFHWAVWYARLNVARELLKHGPRGLVDFQDEEGESALYWACAHGRVSLARTLVNEFGAKVELATPCGATPLHAAVQNGDLELIRFLVEEAQANINAADQHGDTPLHVAVSFEQREVVEYLLQREGLDHQRRNSAGQTAEDVCADLSISGGIGILLEGAREGALGEALDRVRSHQQTVETLKELNKRFN